MSDKDKCAISNLEEAAKNLLEACYQAEAKGKLPKQINESLLIAVRDALIGMATLIILAFLISCAARPKPRFGPNQYGGYGYNCPDGFQVQIKERKLTCELAGGAKQP